MLICTKHNNTQFWCFVRESLMVAVVNSSCLTSRHSTLHTNAGRVGRRCSTLQFNVFIVHGHPNWMHCMYHPIIEVSIHNKYAYLCVFGRRRMLAALLGTCTNTVAWYKDEDWGFTTSTTDQRTVMRLTQTTTAWLFLESIVRLVPTATDLSFWMVEVKVDTDSAMPLHFIYQPFRNPFLIF